MPASGGIFHNPGRLKAARGLHLYTAAGSSLNHQEIHAFMLNTLIQVLAEI